jgi:hypothetical protein
MQEVIEKYYGDHKKAQEILKKIIPIKYPWVKPTDSITTSFDITERDKIEKVFFDVEVQSHWPDPFHGSLKVYELAFVDYPDLNSEDVLEIINGFIAFLRRHEFEDEKVREKIDEFCQLLELNPNLPEDLELWIKIR